MTNQQPHTGSVAALRCLAEDLAIDLVVKAERAHTARGLEKMLAAADASGHQDISRDIRALQTALAGGPSSPGYLQAAQDGVRRLQEALHSKSVPESAAKPALKASLSQDAGLVSDFLMEAREHLTAVEDSVLAIERDPGNPDAVHAMFRAFHTIKGLAGFLEFTAIRDASHEVESLLDLARNRTLALTAPALDIILESADFLSRELQRIEAAPRGGPTVPADEALPLMQRIRAIASGSAPAPAATPAAASVVRAERSRSAGSAKSIKVDTAKLDSLIDLVGEMMIAQSLICHTREVSTSQNAGLLRHVNQLTRITNDVQKATMSMRMVPIGVLFQRMARLVRDLGHKAGKQAELFTVGDDTELDRNIVEELADPLVHMVRNALDHGIEAPGDRIAAGKPAQARVELRASHLAGHIVIEIADDGRGMHRDVILRKAREKGLVSENATLSDQEIFNLVFEPGFSTAAAVTDISGRGVGMDVVNRHIQKLRGRAEIQTQAGRGTTFRLRLPLTLAIIDGLIVGVGGERFVVPLFSVVEMLRPTPGMVTTMENRREVALLRDRVLPVLRLHRRFGITPRSEDPTDSLLLVTESQGRTYCLMVDALLGKQEVVIKSLGETLMKTQGLAGCAILGDGRVGLILDVNELFGPVRAG